MMASNEDIGELLRDTPVFVFTQNRELKYGYALNQSIACSETNILGKTDRELFPGNYEELESLKRQVMATGETLRRRIALRTEPPDTRWFDLTLKPLKNPRGRLAGVAGTAVDITEHVERQSELEAADEAKTRVLSALSHDIRAPLTAIMGLAETLEEILDHDHREIGGEIKNACNHLIATLDSVLDLARLQGDAARLSTEPIPLLKLLENVRDTFDPARKRPDGKPRVRMSVDDEDLRVMGEYGALLRVLGNLLGNALKFCPDAPVSLRAFKESDHAAIEVEDHGPGIAEAFIPDLFKPFTREMDSRKSDRPGSGLGLSIAHELVQLMDGSIDVRSAPGQGTTMTVRLPLAESEGPAPVANHRGDEAAGETSLPRTVICDDHEPTCKIIRRMIGDPNVRVVNGETELFEQLDGAEALLLDINLHAKSRGIEIMKQLRSDGKYRDLRIIAFTAHALPGQRERFIEEGFDDYLKKPFRRQELLDKIARAATPPTKP